MTSATEENCSRVKRIHRFWNIFICVSKKHTFLTAQLKHDFPANRITLRARKALRVISLAVGLLLQLQRLYESRMHGWTASRRSAPGRAAQIGPHSWSWRFFQEFWCHEQHFLRSSSRPNVYTDTTNSFLHSLWFQEWTKIGPVSNEFTDFEIFHVFLPKRTDSCLTFATTISPEDRITLRAVKALRVMCNTNSWLSAIPALSPRQGRPNWTSLMELTFFSRIVVSWTTFPSA